MSRMAYIGTCAGCGSVVAACVDEGPRNRISKFCAEIIKDGDILSRVTCDEAREKLAFCTCNAPDSKQLELVSPTPNDGSAQ